MFEDKWADLMWKKPFDYINSTNKVPLISKVTQANVAENMQVFFCCRVDCDFSYFTPGTAHFLSRSVQNTVQNHALFRCVSVHDNILG
jgi:hypothetical protein